MISARMRHALASAFGAVVLWAAAAGCARAQPDDDPNRGSLRFTGGLDVPTVYVFRGIVEEGDPKLTLTPYGELGIVFGSADRPPRVNVGVWNSLNTGSAGTGGPLDKLHLAEHFYATLILPLPGRLTFAPSFRAITSPNGSFNSVREIDVSLAHDGFIAPYVFLAAELSNRGQLDEGSKRGTYLELGATPHAGLPFAHATLGVPVKVGLSVSNYYEIFGTDLKFHNNSFGFFDVGGVLTIPLQVPARFGRWNAHGGADYLRFGDTTKAFNSGKDHKVVASIGVGVSY